MLALFLYSLTFLSSARTTHTNGYWAGFFTKSELAQNLDFHQEFQIRKNTETGITTQSLFRGGPLWQWTETSQLGLLYAYVRTGPQSEHRLTQQWVYKATDTFSLRTRFEQRTLEKNNGVGLRLRLLARYQQSFSESHSFVLWDEYFDQLTRPTWLFDDDFDRNRYFLGLRSQWNKITFEYGYMNQYANRHGSDLSEHLFLFYLII